MEFRIFSKPIPTRRSPIARNLQRRLATTGDRTLALTHNLGGYPGEMVSFVGVVGSEPG